MKNRKFALTLAPDEYDALDSLAGRLEIGKADYLRLIIRSFHLAHELDKALANGKGMVKMNFQGFGFQIDAERITKLIDEGANGLTKILNNPEEYFHILQASSSQMTRRQKGRLTKKKEAA